MSNNTCNIGLIKQKLSQIGLKAEKCLYGLIDKFVANNVILNSDACKLWKCNDQFQDEHTTELAKHGVEAAVITSQYHSKSCRFVYLRKNTIFELASLSNFEQNYKEKIQDLCQQD